MPRKLVQWHAQQRASFAPTSWSLLFGVFADGEVVGAQDVSATQHFARRVVSSGSWIGRRYHGRGLGTEMREAILQFAFAELDAQAAESDAWEGNAASLRVSEKCGYQHNGIVTRLVKRGQFAPDGVATEEIQPSIRLRIERARWQERRRNDIEVHGLDDDLRGMLGAMSPD